MLYDMKVHLPQIVDEILKSYTAGELDKLYRQKTLVCKIMNDTDLLGKMKLIDEEKDKQRKQTITYTLEEIKKLTNMNDIEQAYVFCQHLWETHMKKFDVIESNYWETIISKIKETVDSLNVEYEEQS